MCISFFYFNCAGIAVVGLIAMPAIVTAANYNDTLTCNDTSVDNLTESDIRR